MCELENEWAFARLPHWAHWHFASGSHWQRGEKCEFFHALLESNQWNPFAGKIWQHPAKLKRHSAYFSAQYLTVFWRHTIASGNKNVHFSSAFNSVNIPPTHGWPVMYSSNRIPYGNLKERAETVHCSMGTPKARCREERKKILRFVYLFERQNYKEWGETERRIFFHQLVHLGHSRLLFLGHQHGTGKVPWKMKLKDGLIWVQSIFGIHA